MLSSITNIRDTFRRGASLKELFEFQIDDILKS